MIKNHYLYGAESAPSPNQSGTINPKFLVMHYTASWEVGSVLRTFANRGSKVSAHLTIDTNGDVYQHVAFNKKAWHAGASQYAGYNGLNSHSIGIELVNPGFLKKTSDGRFVDAYGGVHREKNLPPLVAHRNPRVGSGMHYWPMYPMKQLEVAENIAAELINTYSLIDVVSHEEIDTRGWKTDPGPAFPMNNFKKLLPHRNVEHEKYQVTASSLNVRNGPSAEFKVVSRVSRGDVVTGVGISGDWIRINSDGWVHGGYLRRI